MLQCILPASQNEMQMLLLQQSKEQESDNANENLQASFERDEYHLHIEQHSRHSKADEVKFRPQKVEISLRTRQITLP